MQSTKQPEANWYGFPPIQGMKNEKDNKYDSDKAQNDKDKNKWFQIAKDMIEDLQETIRSSPKLGEHKAEHAHR